MMTKVLTLRFNPLTGAFDDQPLVDFTRDKNLIDVRNHFFTQDRKSTRLNSSHT